MKKNRKIVIDPGHGGKDPGAYYGGIKESDLNLTISYILWYELVMKGYDTKLTRTTDVYVHLQDRCNIANDWKADVFVSIHCNANESSEPWGFSILVWPDTKVSIPLVEKIQAQYVQTFPHRKNRGIKKRDLFVIRETKMPACLVECDFLSNPKSRGFLKKVDTQIKLAQIISNGIENYFIGGSNHD